MTSEVCDPPSTTESPSKPVRQTAEVERAEYGPKLGRVATIAATALGAYHLWTGWSGGMRFYRQRSIHLIGGVAVLALIIIEQTNGPYRLLKRAAILSCLSVWCGLFIFIYFNDRDLITRFTKLPLPMLLWGMVALLIGLEAARRVIGWFLPGLTLLFALVILFARPLGLPYGDWLAPVKYRDLLNTMTYSGHGILGSITGVSAGIVASFLVFGAFLSASGGAQSFLNLARFLVGRYRGGPAKVSLVTSAFFGTVSGSAVANVVVDGVFNIPLMKRSGYRASFAAGVEAAASTGGQLVPPVMGAAAFIMAEFLGVPYSQIILAAILPTALYYIGLGIAIHIEALKQQLPPIPKEQLPQVRDFMNREFFGSFALPIGVLLYALYGMGRSLIYSSFIATMTVAVYILVGLREPFRKRVVRIFQALRDAGVEISRIAAIVISAQLLIGLLGTSGLGARVANELAGADIPLSLSLLFLAMVVVLLGFGVPTAAAYILAAGIANPMFGLLGIDRLAGHMFILYMSVYANVTPPVMPAVYAAAGIARANVMRAGLDASRLLAPVLLVPFVFVQEPGILLTHGSMAGSIWGVARLMVGMTAVSAGLARWFRRPLNLWESSLTVLGGGLFAWPGSGTTIAGTALLAVGILPAALTGRRAGAVGQIGGAGLLSVSGRRVTTWQGSEWDTFIAKTCAQLSEYDAGPDRAVVLGGQPSAAAVVALGAAARLQAPVALVSPELDLGHIPLDALAPRGVALALAPLDVAETWAASRHVAVPIELQLSISAQRAGEPPDVSDLRRRLLLSAGETWGRSVVITEEPDAARRHARTVGAAFGLTSADRILLSAPLHHFLTPQLIDAALEIGSLIVVDEELRFSPERWFETTDAAGVTAAVVTLAQLQALVEHCETSEQILPIDLSAVIHGDEACSEELKRRAIDAFGPILIQYYAMPEMGGTVVQCEDWLEFPTTVGRAWSGDVKVVLVDEHDVRGNQGRVAFEPTLHGREVNYLTQDGELTSVLDDEGLFITTDVGHVDGGHLFLEWHDQHELIPGLVDDRRPSS
jgi:TRAP transporter 4TM/12TM fusion protein